MTARPRKLALLVVAMTLGLTVAILASTRHDDPAASKAGKHPTRSSTPAASKPTVLGPAAPRRRALTAPGALDDVAAPGPGNGQAARRREQLASPKYLHRQTPRATQVARNFLGALLDYEVRQQPRQAAQMIRSTATANLAREVLQGPARLPQSLKQLPPRGRLRHIALEFDKPPTALAVRATVERGDDLSQIGLLLTLKGSRWTVSHITE